MSTPWRTAIAVRVAIVAALTSTAAIAGYQIASSGKDTPGAAGDSDTTAGGQINVASFTTADVGSCLTWDVTDGVVTNFEQVDCALDHRFEVTAREDLGAYPSSEFGANAPRPNQTRQAQLREELCLTPTVSYLSGSYDPVGKYSIAPILPPQELWEAGDRTLLCGVQVTDDTGTVVTSRGRAVEQDQSRIFAAGDCIAIDAVNATRKVDCTEPHQMETTAVEDLLAVFPTGIPSIADQDAYLKQRCTSAAHEYLGSEEALYRSTLQPFWTTVPANSWSGGSHSANCSLVYADGNNFAALTGSATGEFLINGNPPAQRPDRPPIVTESRSAANATSN